MASLNNQHDTSTSAEEQRERRLQRRQERDIYLCMVDCKVKEVRGGGSDVTLSNYTKIETSPKKFPSLAVGTTEPDAVALEDIGFLAIDQLVSVMVKANVVDAPETVTNRDGKQVQTRLHRNRFFVKLQGRPVGTRRG